MVHHCRAKKGDEEQQLLQQQPQKQQLPHLDESAAIEAQHHLHHFRSLASSYCGGKKGNKRGGLCLLLVLLLCFVSFTVLAAPRLLFGSSLPLPFYLFGAEDGDGGSVTSGGETHLLLPCSRTPSNAMCCDRSTSSRTDVCVMRGDVRFRPSNSSVHLYGAEKPALEKIRPYTRKWETSIMSTIAELDLVATQEGEASSHDCDVRHSVPVVVFSTGGYTGNVYHEFNDGVLPLYITSQRFGGKVVFAMLDYHNWWVTKYGDILSQLSDYPPIDFSGDKRTHCFPEAVVGLRIHEELAVDSSQMPANETILDFRQLLDRAYAPRIRSLEQDEEAQSEAAASAAVDNGTQLVAEAAAEAPEPSVMERPKLTILSRNGSRGIENERELVSLCEEIGFSVRVLRPDRTTELAKIYRELNDSDAAIGVHGAAMTHLLFMRPGSVLIQVVPLGTDWAAETYYGQPARRMGLRYVGYKILPRESSLADKYAKDDPVLRDPASVTSKGWQATKEVYLDGQSVRLDLNRFLRRLTRAYQHAVSRRNGGDRSWKGWGWQQPRQQRRR